MAEFNHAAEYQLAVFPTYFLLKLINRVGDIRPNPDDRINKGFFYLGLK